VFNIDKKIKDKAMKRAKSKGVPFASVLKFATKAFADGRLTVDIVEPERFNKKTAREIRAALRDAKQGKNVISFKSAKEMDDYLLSL
jgi:antitoxin component of RelBE/YafQ-DinJ toxin-antitoxin module